MIHIFNNTDFGSDILFTRGPMDVLDHSSDNFSFGGKAGVDATVKMPEEMEGKFKTGSLTGESSESRPDWLNVPFIKRFRFYSVGNGIIILILAVDPSYDPGSVRKVCDLLKKNTGKLVFRLVVVVDHTVDLNDLFMLAWQVLGNSDPVRDHFIISPDSLLIDGTIKFFREGGFSRLWPNIVCSDAATIEKTDKKWSSLGFETFIKSPSLKYMELNRNGTDNISK
jgi:4-hydroxy-3-polyprenylbenzoate decarboxylase